MVWSQVQLDASLLRVAHVRVSSLLNVQILLDSPVASQSLFDRSQPSHYQHVAEICIVRGSASWSGRLAHRSPCLKEEDSISTRRAYEACSIAAIHKHDKPIHSEQDPSMCAPHGLLSTSLGHTTHCTFSVACYWPRCFQPSRSSPPGLKISL